MTSRRILAAVALLCAIALPSHAQAQAVVWPTPQSFGAACDGVTDDATALQAALNSLSPNGGVIYTPSGSVCLFGSTLTIPQNAVTLRGLNNKNGNITTPSTWIYTGTGTRAIDARDTGGFRIDGMQIVYSSASFTGSLIDVSGLTPGSSVTFTPTIYNSFLGTSTGRTGTATLVNAGGTVDLTLDTSYFYHGAPSLLGEGIIGQNVRTTIRNNTFAFNENVTISSCGVNWIVEGNSFEPNTVGQAETFGTISAFPCQGGVWTSNFFGDVTADGGTWIDGFFQGTSFIGNQMAGPTGVANTTGIKLNSSAGVVVSGNRFELLTNAINCVASNNGVRVNGNYFVNVTAEVANPSNCSALNTDGNFPPVSQQGSGQIAVGQSGADPLPKTMSGDATLASSGALTVAGINGVDQTAAWTTYTPTITAQAGTPAATSATGRYRQIGKTVIAEMDVTITSAGTASGAVNVSLPLTAAAFRYAGFGFEYAVTGKGGAGYINGSVAPTILQLLDASAVTFWTSGRALAISTTYEIP
jgi:hypothetical protein